MWSAHSVSEISDNISSVVNEATIGRRPWADLCNVFTEAFPGSYAALLNQNFVRPEVSFAVASGLEERHLRSFITHFSYVNPWRCFWQYAKNGSILVSGRDSPAKQYHGSEFYEDWMRAVGDYDAAVGLRLQVDDDEIVYLPVHFSDRMRGAYEPYLESVVQNTRGSLTNALEIACYVRHCSETAASQSALSCFQGTIAFVMDDRMRLFDANSVAIAAFNRGFPAHCCRDVVRFNQPHATARIKNAIQNRSNDLSLKLLMMVRDERWLISINQLPQIPANDLLTRRARFLTRLQKVGFTHSELGSDVLAEIFGLTPSEVLLSKALGGGLMLADAARLNNISYENARQKLKSIFKKTNVSSQSDLRLLIHSLE